MATLNTKTSIVDKLKSEGKDSSYAARKKLAEESGIKNYTGTAEQNSQLLNSGNKPTPTGGGSSSNIIDNSGTTISSGGINPVIKNQSNLLTSTAAERAKLNNTGVNIDNTVNNLGTAKFGPNGEYTYKVDSKGVPYGAPLNTSTDTPTDPTKPIKPTLPEGNIKDSTGNTYFSSMPEDLTYQLPSLTNDKKWVFDASGKPFEMDSAGTVTSNTLADSEYNKNIQANKEIETQNDMYDTLKANISAAHQVIIDNIKQKAKEQKTAMEDLNKRYLGAKTVAGFRTGGTEYTPEIAMGILKNEEEEGIRRIKDIDDNMTLALAEAVSAKNDKDLQVAQQKFDTYSKLQKAKETAIVDQYKLYLDNQKYIADATKALETESRAKKDQSMQELKAGADAYLRAYNASKDKKAYIQSIATKLGLDAEIVLGQILNAQPKAKTTSTSGGKQTSTEIKADAIGEMATGLSSKAGSDGYVDPQLWIAARKRWVENKLNDADFLKNFKQYLNPESYKLIPEFAPKKTTTSNRPS